MLKPPGWGHDAPLWETQFTHNQTHVRLSKVRASREEDRLLAHPGGTRERWA